jgi:hypothetical protein
MPKSAHSSIFGIRGLCSPRSSRAIEFLSMPIRAPNSLWLMVRSLRVLFKSIAISVSFIA